MLHAHITLRCFVALPVRKAAPFASAVALAVLGVGGGIIAPQIAYAQSIAKTNNEAPDRASLGAKIRPDAPVVIAPAKDTGYDVTKHTKDGSEINIQSPARFGTIVEGNYLFVVSPDGNYLFTGLSNGRLLLPGGYNVTVNGDLIAPDGKPSTASGTSVTTPQGLTISVAKDGTCTLVLPDKSVFTVRRMMGKNRNPSGLYWG